MWMRPLIFGQEDGLNLQIRSIFQAPNSKRKGTKSVFLETGAIRAQHPWVMYNDLSSKGWGVEFTYALHIAKTAKVHILARYV